MQSVLAVSIEVDYEETEQSLKNNLFISLKVLVFLQNTSLVNNSVLPKRNELSLQYVTEKRIEYTTQKISKALFALGPDAIMRHVFEMVEL